MRVRARGRHARGRRRVLVLRRPVILVASSSYQEVLDGRDRRPAALLGRRSIPDLYGDALPTGPEARIIAGRPGVKIPSCQGERLSYRRRRTATRSTACRTTSSSTTTPRLFPQLSPTRSARSRSRSCSRTSGATRCRTGPGTVRSRRSYQELQADCFAGACSTTSPTNGNPVDAESAATSRSSLGAMLQFSRRARHVARRPVGARQRVRPRQRVPGRLRVRRRAVRRPTSRPPAAPRGAPVHQRGPTPDQGGRRPRRRCDPAHRRPAQRLLLAGRAAATRRSRPRTSPPSTAASAGPIPKCGAPRPTSSRSKNRVFYCLDDGYVAFDEPFLQSVYDEIGDFGVASLIANPWATYVQTIQGIPGVADNNLEVVLQTDCYRGGWRGRVLQRRPRGRLSSRPATSTSSCRHSSCTAAPAGWSPTSRSRSCGWRSSGAGFLGGYKAAITTTSPKRPPSSSRAL